MLGAMTPAHPRWLEFEVRLAGPEACDFREDEGGELRWRCGHTRDLAVAILRTMGISDRELVETLDYFDEHGGHCDCEIVLNVAPD